MPTITMNAGTMITESGIISVDRMSANMALRPAKRYFDSAKAAMEIKSSVKTVATTVTNTVFQR